MTVWYAVIAVLTSVLAFGSALHALLNVRDSSSALGWIAVCLLVLSRAGEGLLRTLAACGGAFLAYLAWESWRGLERDGGGAAGVANDQAASRLRIDEADGDAAPAAASADMFELDEDGRVRKDARGFNPVVVGGKAVIIGDPATLRSEDLIRAYGRVVDSLGGRYVTAEDVGTTVEDMVLISEETQWVSGLPRDNGGSGDPSPATARGVMAALRAIGERLWGSDDLAGRRVARLAGGLLEAGPQAFTWNGRDHLGRSVPSGQYVVRLSGTGTDEKQKITLLR